MARPPTYKTVEIAPTKLLLDSKKISIKPLYVKAMIKSQNNGGARITLSENYVGYEAIIFITNKKKK